jgi:E3 ubiquitin-protein ligase EDD1
VTTASEPSTLVVESNPIVIATTTTTTTTVAPAANSNTTTLSSSIENSSTVVPPPLPPPDNAPLFWQPCSGGFYSIRAGRNTPERLNAYRNVGRIIAVCLLQNELCPITLSRHVIKYILSRPVKWHDLAFYDPQMYESFRKMICDAERILVDAVKNAKNNNNSSNSSESFNAAMTRVDEEIFKPLDLTFSIDLSKEESSSSSSSFNTDIKENGSQVKVTALNMYEFVKLYAEFRMIKNVKLSLDQLKAGVYDVLPASSFDGLHAEDLRLLLNGVADISIHTLASYTTISDESKEASRRAQFEKWFWTTLDRMTQSEKQELLFFWTGSSHLPASEEGFQPLPTITLRPPSDQHLPTANTCINRLYIPVYSSKSILKAKLLQAIKTKTFGFV